MTRTLCLATALACGAGLAGSPAESAAQTGLRPHGMSLGGAIEEARRSPFHALSGLSPSGDAPPGEIGIRAVSAFNPLQSAPEDSLVTAPVILFTFVSAAASHVAAVFLFFSCVDDDSYKSPIIGCILGPIIPWPAVAAPAASAGVGAGKAFKASAFGLLGGAAAFSLTMWASDSISRYGAGVVSTLVHALTVRAMLR